MYMQTSGFFPRGATEPYMLIHLINVYVSMYRHIYTYMYGCFDILIHLSDVYVFIYIYIYIHTYMYTHVSDFCFRDAKEPYISIHLFNVYVSIYIYIHIHTCIQCICIHKYICIHVYTCIRFWFSRCKRALHFDSSVQCICIHIDIYLHTCIYMYECFVLAKQKSSIC